jgi:hypothetical protein
MPDAGCRMPDAGRGRLPSIQHPASSIYFPRSAMKPKYSLHSIPVLLCIFCVGLAAQKVDLTGTWALDKDKSFNNGPGFDQTMTITHTGGKVKLDARQKTPRGETNINEDFTLDGKEAEFAPQGAQPNAKGNRKAIWLPNSRGILVNDEISVDGKLVRQVTRKMTLSADGKVLTVDIFLDDPQRGSFEIKRVYNKAG